MQQQLQATPFNGSVLVVKNGEILLARGYGLADRSFDAPNSPMTHFNIGSLTKQFTAMAILILQSQGKLNVQDPVCKYVSNCPGPWGSMTIHHLLTHQSGFPSDLSDEEQFQAFTQDWSATDLLPLIQRKPLEYAPGSKAAYGSVDYIVASAIIERVSGQAWGDFVRTSMLDPLGMKDTFQDPNNVKHPIPVIPNRARPYAPMGSAYSSVVFLGARQISGAGSLISTASDLSVWDQALYSDRLVPQALLDLMFTWQQGGFGYGWEDGGSFEGHPRAWHTGTLPGFISLYTRLPDVKLTVIELSNVAISAELRDHIAGDLMHLALQAK